MVMRIFPIVNYCDYCGKKETADRESILYPRSSGSLRLQQSNIPINRIDGSGRVDMEGQHIIAVQDTHSAIPYLGMLAEKNGLGDGICILLYRGALYGNRVQHQLVELGLDHYNFVGGIGKRDLERAIGDHFIEINLGGQRRSFLPAGSE